MIYWKLFWTFFKIGLFNFGGGYAMISFIQNEVVYKHAYLSTAEFTNVVALSQVTPGPVGINLATYTGYTASQSVWGALIATAAVCLPSFILMFCLSAYYFKYRTAPSAQRILRGLRLCVIGLIAAAALVLCNAQNFADFYSVFFLAGAFLAVWKFKLSPIVVIVCCGALGLLVY